MKTHTRGFSTESKVQMIQRGPDTSVAASGKKEENGLRSLPYECRRIRIRDSFCWFCRHRLLVVLLLCLLGAGWRQAVIYFAGERVPRGLFGEVVDISRSIAEGHGFANAFGTGSGPTAHTTPVYPLFLAAVFRVFGTNAETLLLWVTGAFVAGAGGVVFLSAGRYGFGPLTAFLGALMAAVLTINPRAEVFGWFENQLAGLVLATYAGFAYGLIREEKTSPWQWSGAGAIGGAAMLTSGVLAGPVIFSWMYAAWMFRRSGVNSRAILATPVAALAVLSPWMIRNWAVLGKPVILRSNFGLELAISNQRLAGALEKVQAISGAYKTLHPYKGEAERRRYVRLGEIRYMEERYREAIDWIRDNPKRFGQLTAARAFNFFFHTGPRTLPTILLSILTLVGAAGMALDLRVNSSRVLFYGGMVLSFSMVYFIVQVSPRYRIPINWVFVLYSAHLIRVMLRKWKRSLLCAEV